MEKLPGDVLTEILIRLPAKQLAQMRSVSKPLNALLSESSFIKSHLNRSIYINDGILLFFPGFCYDREPLKARLSNSPHLELTHFIKYPFNPSDIFDFHDSRVIGSVNGLICFHYGSDVEVIYIWNPSLTALLHLPPCNLPSPGHNINVYFRFGFDPKTDDYKVIKFTGRVGQSRYGHIYGSIFPGSFNLIEEWLQPEVYSMRKGSWKLTSQRFPSRVTNILDIDEVCVDGHNGYLHWLCFIDEERQLPTIVAFDMGAETFSDISLPDSVVDKKQHIFNISLGFLAGKLCFILCIRDCDCEVWVMEEYGVAQSWVKHHLFSQFSGDISPIGLTLRNEFLFEAYNCRLALYDPNEAKVKSFMVSPRIYGQTKVILYVDSLVWVTPAKGVISGPLDVAPSVGFNLLLSNNDNSV